MLSKEVPLRLDRLEAFELTTPLRMELAAPTLLVKLPEATVSEVVAPELGPYLAS